MTVSSQSPTASTTTSPAHVSPSMCRSIHAIGASRHTSSPVGRAAATARMRSWPSRKTCAVTVTASPTQRLAAWRPPATAGPASSMTMRGGGCRAGESGIGPVFYPMVPLADRASGVLLHPTSLPGGRLGDEARAFVDWLAAAGQSWWQVLPLTPPDEHDSPYKSASAFAAWPGVLEDPGAPGSGAEQGAVPGPPRDRG